MQYRDHHLRRSDHIKQCTFLYFVIFFCSCVCATIQFRLRSEVEQWLQPLFHPCSLGLSPALQLQNLSRSFPPNDDDGDDGLAAMIASVFKYLRAIRCLRFVCCSIICLKITLVCRVLSPLTGCGLDDQDTNQF